MNKSLIWILGIIVLIVLVPFLLFGGTYNSLVNLDEEVNGKWANIETQLQRRADLIPNLVNTVQGYASHEKEIITALAEARSKLVGAKTPEEAATANNELNSALNRLLVIVENYPDLKANENFLNLQDELAGTENRIQNARDNYNDSVKQFNKKIKSFPTNIVSGMMGFDKREYFEAKSGSQNVPDVNFD